MTWPTHLAGGIVCGLALAPLGAPESVVLLLIGAMIGALLPDLDIPTSRLSRTKIAGIRPLQLPARLLYVTLGHRGPLHSFLGMAVACGALSIPLIAVGLWPLSVGLFTGFLSHLLLDAITKSGVPLLWPDPRRMHLLPAGLRLTTGSQGEDLIFAMLAAATLSLLVRLIILGAPVTP